MSDADRADQRVRDLYLHGAATRFKTDKSGDPPLLIIDPEQLQLEATQQQWIESLHEAAKSEPRLARLEEPLEELLRELAEFESAAILLRKLGHKGDDTTILPLEQLAYLLESVVHAASQEEAFSEETEKRCGRVLEVLRDPERLGPRSQQPPRTTVDGFGIGRMEAMQRLVEREIDLHDKGLR